MDVLTTGDFVFIQPECNFQTHIDTMSNWVENPKMNDEVDDWYNIEYRETEPHNGQPLHIITPSMDEEQALSFLAQMMSKKHEIVGIIKNKIELDAATIELMKNQSKQAPKFNH